MTIGSAFCPALKLGLTQRAILVLAVTIDGKVCFFVSRLPLKLDSYSIGLHQACIPLGTNQIEFGQDLIRHLIRQHGYVVTRVWGGLEPVHHLQAKPTHMQASQNA